MQACLRVTYTSPHTMPWVTKLLHLLWQHRCNPNSVEAGNAVLNLLEGSAIEEVKEKLKDRNLGTGTPRILFNFLNYLLWRDGLVSTNEEDEKRRRISICLLEFSRALVSSDTGRQYARRLA